MPDTTVADRQEPCLCNIDHPKSCGSDLSHENTARNLERALHVLSGRKGRFMARAWARGVSRVAGAVLCHRRSPLTAPDRFAFGVARFAFGVARFVFGFVRFAFGFTRFASGFARFGAVLGAGALEKS
jgi:hypothetical protein